VELSPFRIERFYARYEHSTRFMLSSSDCESRTIGALLELEPDAHGRLLETWCGYTESPGGPALRQAIASLYERTSAEEVVATSCAEEGIFLLYHAVARPGDHVIVETPCYESSSFGRANMPDALDLLEANLTNGQRRPRDAPDGSAPRAGRD
jgi:DNA-binding transcriptional MocR family regulator